jgi:hypothetical protein
MSGPPDLGGFTIDLTNKDTVKGYKVGPARSRPARARNQIAHRRRRLPRPDTGYGEV